VHHPSRNTAGFVIGFEDSSTAPGIAPLAKKDAPKFSVAIAMPI